VAFVPSASEKKGTKAVCLTKPDYSGFLARPYVGSVPTGSRVDWDAVSPLNSKNLCSVSLTNEFVQL
jgi:hypothetical protein